MRIVFLGATLCVLAGCATVSMVPGEATVETGLSAEQTALRATSEAYCETLEDKGWVSASNGFANLASILMHGQSAEGDGAGYLDQFEDATDSPAELVSRIAADAASARAGLQGVTLEASRVLADQSAETQRGDVTSFERALVRAQRASRAFSSARDIVAGRTSETGPADEAIAAFEGDIDDARRLADELANRYAGIGETSI
jgi:hypothetical protein